MANLKYKRTIITLLLLVLGVGSVVSGTMAWFTDSVESTGNVIKSGSLDLTLEMLDENGNWISAEGEDAPVLFDYTLWEPGVMQNQIIRIRSIGDLALEYTFEIATENSDEYGPSLADAIDVYISSKHKESIANTNREQVLAAKNSSSQAGSAIVQDWYYCGTLSEFSKGNATTGDINLKTGIIAPELAMIVDGQKYEIPGAPDGSYILNAGTGEFYVKKHLTCNLLLHMREDAGNEYQGLDLGNVTIKLEAKQYSYEADAFNNLYDQNATWPEDLSTILYTPGE